MDFAKDLINGSPYVGVFGIVTDEIAIFPRTLTPVQLLRYKRLFNVDIVQCTLAGTTLVGILGSGIGKRLVVSDLVQPEEVDFLKSYGLQCLVLPHASALGNWLTMNAHACVHGGILSSDQVKAVKSFLNVPVMESKVAGSDLTGSNCRANSVGFIVNPGVSQSELQVLEKVLHVKGMRTTANYGDRFVGNSILVNSFGALIGANTTTHEMIRIDEIFRK